MLGGTLIIQNSKLAKQRPICQNSSKNMNIVRVVVVEDHDLTRMGLVAALQHRGNSSRRGSDQWITGTETARGD